MLANLGLLSACATKQPSTEEAAAENAAPVRLESDPWEPMNRGIYRANRAFDSILLKPVAKGYQKILPAPVRRSIGNFSINLFAPRSAANNFLQGKPRRGFEDIARFMFNITIGIGGLFDAASAGGLPQYNEKFSETMAVWGFPEGPYLVLPLLGPQSLLDALMLPIDIKSDPLLYINNTSFKDHAYIVRVIDLRARLLIADKMLEQSNDPYATLRESYLQKRQYDIHDGNPPVDEEMYDDFFDEE